MVLLGSGANICATFPAILHIFSNLGVYKWPSPRVITFGNGNSGLLFTMFQWKGVSTLQNHSSFNYGRLDREILKNTIENASDRFKIQV